MEQPWIQRPQIVEAYLFQLAADQLSADVLQRPHPVPIGQQAFGTQGPALQHLSADPEIRILIGFWKRNAPVAYPLADCRSGSESREECKSEDQRRERRESLSIFFRLPGHLI